MLNTKNKTKTHTNIHNYEEKNLTQMTENDMLPL